VNRWTWPPGGARGAVTWTVLFVDVVAVVLDIGDFRGPLRFVVSLLFALTVPGWSIVGYLRSREVAWLLSLCVATSLAVEVVVGEIVLSWWWHLQILEILLGAVTGALLVGQLRRGSASLDEVRR
jgi:hypothetical protein